MNSNYFESMDYVSPLRQGSYWSSEIQLDECGDEIVVHSKKWAWLPVIVNCIAIVIFFGLVFYFFSKDVFLARLKMFVIIVTFFTVVGVCVGVYIQNVVAGVPKVSFSRSKRCFFFPRFMREINHDDVLLFQLIIGDGWGEANLIECNVMAKEGDNVARYPIFKSRSLPQKLEMTMEDFAFKTGVTLQCVSYGIHSSPKSISYKGGKSRD